jgi:hypothetical protein
MVHFAKKVPIVAGERTIRVRTFIDARRATRFAPGWFASIVKAFGIVSDRIPDLRRAYLPYPWPRLYEHPHSVASVVLDREYLGEHATFLCPMLHPERLPLVGVHEKLRALQQDPIEKHGTLRRLVRHSRFPLPVRRALWGIGLNWSGNTRARFFGTFGVNSIAGFRGRMLQFVTPITSVLYFGTPTRDGELDVQLAFDHRVFDGYTAGRAVSELESVLNTEIAAEIRQSGRAAA